MLFPFPMKSLKYVLKHLRKNPTKSLGLWSIPFCLGLWAASSIVFKSIETASKQSGIHLVWEGESVLLEMSFWLLHMNWLQGLSKKNQLRFKKYKISYLKSVFISIMCLSICHVRVFYLFLCLCRYMLGALGGQKKVSGPLKLKLHMVLSCHVSVVNWTWVVSLQYLF